MKTKRNKKAVSKSPPLVREETVCIGTSVSTQKVNKEEVGTQKGQNIEATLPKSL